MLLDHAADRSSATNARQIFNGSFYTVIKLIAGSKARGDLAWRPAERKLQFPEVPLTCLGYGASAIRGSGGAAVETSTPVQTGSEIIELGVTDPDLFVATALACRPRLVAHPSIPSKRLHRRMPGLNT